jgi:hypothetical protein
MRFPAICVAVATVVALASAWHSGRHMWHRLADDRRTFTAYSDEQRLHALLTVDELPPSIFDWYASLLARGDRAYFQVQESGFSSFVDVPTAFGLSARYYLLPVVQVTDPRAATVVVSYKADPSLLHLHFVTQQRAGLQLYFVSRIRPP